MAKADRLARIIVAEQGDARERVKALSLQVHAWRQLAMIAMHAPEYAKAKAGWLMMNSVPFVNGPALESFIAEHSDMAERHGIACGVLSEKRHGG